MEMTISDLEEVKTMIETFGVDQVLEHVAMACDDIAEDCDVGGHDEDSRKWRVRHNGVMQGLRCYQEFVKERNA